MPRQTIRLTAIGWKACTALTATGGVARVLAPLTASTYMVANGEVLWLGRQDGARHPRAMLAADVPLVVSDTLKLHFAGLKPWRPRSASPCDPTRMRLGAMNLLGALRRREGPEGRPAGLGVLLVGRPLSFPLDRAADAVRAMADACECDDAPGTATAGEPLLGLGPGLTPSGDDFVGGVLFARHALAPGDAAWSAAAAWLLKQARTRTHPVSAALMTDLAHGEAHEPLHDLIDALTEHVARPRALRAVERLSRLGHSSGWDMLTGILVGLAGPAALDPMHGSQADGLGP